MFSTDQINHVRHYVKNLKPTIGGRLLYYFFPFRKRLVLKNMRQVFDSVLSENEIIKLAQSFYSHIFTMLRESILLRLLTQEQLKNRAIVKGEKNLVNSTNNQIRGSVVITGHFGNWEFAPIAGILNFTEVKEQFHFVRKRQSIKLLEKILFKRYFEVGLGIIDKKDSLSQVYQKLEDNQIVVLVMDQHAKGKEGLMVDFFGKKTSTYRTVAMMVRESQVPVIPARSYRQKDGKHVLEFFPPLPWIEDEDPVNEIYLNTLQYNQTLEKFILEYPEQWLWMYKHWKVNKNPART